MGPNSQAETPNDPPGDVNTAVTGGGNDSDAGGYGPDAGGYGSDGGGGGDTQFPPDHQDPNNRLNWDNLPEAPDVDFSGGSGDDVDGIALCAIVYCFYVCCIKPKFGPGFNGGGI